MGQGQEPRDYRQLGGKSPTGLRFTKIIGCRDRLDLRDRLAKTGDLNRLSCPLNPSKDGAAFAPQFGYRNFLHYINIGFR